MQVDNLLNLAFIVKAGNQRYPAFAPLAQGGDGVSVVGAQCLEVMPGRAGDRGVKSESVSEPVSFPDSSTANSVIEPPGSVFSLSRALIRVADSDIICDFITH